MNKFGIFVAGVIVGVYLDQSHTMPNIEKWAAFGFKKIKEFEETTRKDNP